MRVLLRPVLVPELGLVVLKPGRESMPVFHNTRVLVEPEPKSMRNLSSGEAMLIALIVICLTVIVTALVTRKDLCEVRIRTGQTEVAVFTAYEPEE
ncbi:protein hokD [Escherichia coli KTE83]|nr:type I toxin-antitoxin system Hok family toxin [Escherichia coli]ELE83475.1 protein hokD [Escherichia coli KTE83]